MTQEPFMIGAQCYFVVGAGELAEPLILSELAANAANGSPELAERYRVRQREVVEAIRSMWEAVHGRKWP